MLAVEDDSRLRQVVRAGGTSACCYYNSIIDQLNYASVRQAPITPWSLNTAVIYIMAGRGKSEIRSSQAIVSL